MVPVTVTVVVCSGEQVEGPGGGVGMALAVPLTDAVGGAADEIADERGAPEGC